MANLVFTLHANIVYLFVYKIFNDYERNQFVVLSR